MTILLQFSRREAKDQVMMIRCLRALPFSGNCAHVECITGNSDWGSVNPVLQSRHDTGTESRDHRPQCAIGLLQGWNKLKGREGECPSRFRCKGTRMGLCPLTFQWLHSLWSDWNSVKTNESVCWPTQCLQIYILYDYSFQTHHGHSMHGLKWGGEGKKGMCLQ